MSTSNSARSGWTTADLTLALRATVRGDVVTAEDPGFAAAAFGVDTTAGHAPEVVVIAVDVQDVAAVVRLAAGIGRRVRTIAGIGDRSVGAPLRVPADTILVVTRLLARVRVDPTAREVTAGVGAGWREVLRALAPLGLTVLRDADRPVGPAGSPDPTRGVIAGFEVVTGDGSVRQLRAGRGDAPDRERFAALADGATCFGVVTAITLRVAPPAGAVEPAAGTAAAPAARRELCAVPGAALVLR